MVKYNVSVQLELVTDGIKALKIAYVFAPVGSDESHYDNLSLIKYESESEGEFLKRISGILEDVNTIKKAVSNDIKNNRKIEKESNELEELRNKVKQQINRLDNIRFEIELDD